MAVAGGLLISTADRVGANHFHVTCNNHGLVHGGSTFDGVYHSRVEGGPCIGESRCDTGFAGSIIIYGIASPGFTCDNIYNSPVAECKGNAWTRLDGHFVYHRHDAHSPC